ncbi:MAG: Lrp/AsnC ligand binding domain-containing protein [Methanomassiliicoccales archaeon]
MPSGMVLLNSEIGSESKVLDELVKLDEVERAYLIYGVYDILAEVTADTMEELQAIITGKVRLIPGVRSTLTLVVSKRYK